MTLEIIGLDRNRPIVAAEFAACRDLVTALALSSTTSDASAFGDERKWLVGDIDPPVPVYRGFASFSLGDFNYDFVRQLRQHCYIFTGYRLSDIVTGKKTLSWTDIESYPMQDLYPEDWSVPFHLIMEQQVPPDLVCDPPLVAGEVGYDVKGRCINRDVVSYQGRVLLLNLVGRSSGCAGSSIPESWRSAVVTAASPIS